MLFCSYYNSMLIIQCIIIIIIIIIVISIIIIISCIKWINGGNEANQTSHRK